MSNFIYVLCYKIKIGQSNTTVYVSFIQYIQISTIGIWTISYRSMAGQQGTFRPDWQHGFPEVEERFLAHTGPISPDTGYST
jgi:hypothetical protein